MSGESGYAGTPCGTKWGHDGSALHATVHVTCPVGFAGVQASCPQIRRRLPLLVAAAALLVPGGGLDSGTSARAEILVMQDGRRVQCRILLKSKAEVTVREAGGSEITYDRKDISRIDPAVSSVEVYEAVLESMSPGHGLVPYHLGRWCRERDPKIDCRRLFEMAARDPFLRARAYVALAEAARSPGDRSRFLGEAVGADPSLSEATDALRAAGSAPVEMPAGLLRAMSDMVRELINGRPKAAVVALGKIRTHSDARTRNELERRLRDFTGLSFKDIRKKAGSKRVADVPGPEDGSCGTCAGSGYRTCETCGGQGFVPCRRCSGRGKVITHKRIPKRGTVSRVSTAAACPTCKGAGGRDCPMCLRRRTGPVVRTRTVRVESLCRWCNGRGVRSVRRGVSRSTYTSRVTCGSCLGSGTEGRNVSASIRVSGSGIRRCAICNKDGHIPLGGPKRTPSSTARHRLPDPTMRIGMAGQGTRQLSDFSQLLSLALEGRPDLRWRAGPKVPFELARAAADRPPPGPSGGQIFACGRWCTASMKRLLLQRAKNSGHNPRPVDISEFRKWMIAQELAYLRSRSLPCGSGQKPAAEVRAFVRLWESARGLASAGDTESSRLACTTFAPTAPSAGQAARPFVASGFRFVLLHDPKDWPDLEVVLEPAGAAGSGLALGPVKVAHGSLPGSLTLFYQVRLVESRAERRGVGARRRVKVIAQIYAATLGQPENPRRVWICGMPARSP